MHAFVDTRSRLKEFPHSLQLSLLVCNISMQDLDRLNYDADSYPRRPDFTVLYAWSDSYVCIPY